MLCATPVRHCSALTEAVRLVIVAERQHPPLWLSHTPPQVLGELGSDPARFLEEAVGFVRAQTDFFSRPGAAATLQHLLAPAAAAPAPAAEAKPAAAAPPAPAGAQVRITWTPAPL